MTFIVDHQQFFKDCVDFTVQHNIGVVRKKAARLVSIASLQQFVEQKYGDQCSYYFAMSKGLDDFINSRGKIYKSFVSCGDWKRWDFELMYTNDYYSDPRFAYRYFPELVENKSSHTLLFICYSEENHHSYLEDIRSNRKMMERDQELSEEIMNLYRELKPTQAMIDDRRSLKNRIQYRLNQVWPDMDLKVAVFG
ncbi:hypothetical protein BCV72DRAFT_121796 [Rhizopus microsporus var. microsporus]|nr:hypothetical protein BCV72DRAFT_121796 [Rhizopus microsporus var. microsporus]